MKIAVIGTGYVGLVTGACFAEMGNSVVCVDNDAAKVERLKNGNLPIHEPGLDVIVASNLREGRLRFSTSLPEAVAALEAAGVPVEGHVRPGLGHGIDEEGLRLGLDFLKRVFGPARAHP